MKLEFMSFSSDKFAKDGMRNRAVLAYNDNTRIEVESFLTPETLAAIQRDASVAAANRLNLQPEV